MWNVFPFKGNIGKEFLLAKGNKKTVDYINTAD